MFKLKSLFMVIAACGGALGVLVAAIALSGALYSVQAPPHGRAQAQMSAAPGDLLPTGADDVQVLEDQAGDDVASAASLTGDPLTGDPRAGERVFARCRACHKLDGSNGLGPHLDGVLGRAVASVAGFSYSPALANHGGIWDPAMLDTWLADPRAAIPGNKMTFAGLKDPQDRADVIAYLGGVD